MKSSKTIVAAAAMAVGLSGCAYHAMSPAEQAVVQNGSWVFDPGANHNLIGCIPPADTQNQAFNDVFKFPARQIAWNASNDPNAKPNRPPYIVVASAKAPAEMDVPVSVTFDLTQDCDKLKRFYSEFAAGYGGVLNDDGSESDGWKALVNHVIGQPLQDTLNGVAQNYPWQDIWNNEEVRTKFREEIDKNLPAASKARTNGVEYFSNFQVTVLKPTPVNQGLKDAIEEQQRVVQVAQAQQAKGVAEAAAAKAKADADVAAATAETQVALQNAIKQQAEINGYGSIDGYLRALCIKQNCNPFQPTYVVPQPAH
jgi:hypothetical protein